MGYRRISSLDNTFNIESREGGLDSRGRSSPGGWSAAGTLSGILAGATPEQQLRWNQLGHPITHTIASKGIPMAESDNRLTLGDRHFYIQGIDNPGGLGDWTVYYVEERE